MSIQNNEKDPLVSTLTGLPVVLGMMTYAFLAGTLIEMREDNRLRAMQGSIALSQASSDTERTVYRYFHECSAPIFPRVPDCRDHAIQSASASGIHPDVSRRLLRHFYTGMASDPY